MTPLILEPSLYLAGFLITEANGRLMDQAYVLFRYLAININISIFLLVVVSKPGVSIRTTCRPSMVNSSATSVVHEFNCFPMRKLEPLAVLMN